MATTGAPALPSTLGFCPLSFMKYSYIPHAQLAFHSALFFKAPVHIITGSAGCKEGRDTFKHNPYPWSAFRSQDYGYTKFAALNKTHIYMEQVSVELSGQAIDSFWLVKNKKLRFD